MNQEFPGETLYSCKHCPTVLAGPQDSVCRRCGRALVAAPAHVGPHRARNPMRRASGEMAAWVGQPLVDLHGAQLGTVHAALVDPETDVDWLIVNLATFGDVFTLAPATGSLSGGGRVWLPLERDKVRAAPRAARADACTDGSFRSGHYCHYGLQGVPRRRPGSRTAERLAV